MGAVAVLVALVALVVPVGPAQAAPLAVDPNDGPEVVVKSVAPGRLDLFTVGADRALHHRAFRDGRWSGWEDLGGQLASTPAVGSLGPDQFDVFARGTDDMLWHTWISGGAWQPWAKLPGSVAIDTAPSVASWGAGHMEVVARSKADGTVWHTTLGSSGWSTMAQLTPGKVTTAPVVAVCNVNCADVFASYTDGRLYHSYLVSGSWQPWKLLPASTTVASAVSVGSWSTNHYDVFVRGTDNAVWHSWMDTAGAWYNMSSLGGSVNSAPSVTSWAAGRFDVVARGTDNALWHVSHNNGAWQPGSSIGGTLNSAPAVASMGAGRVDVFSTGSRSDVLQATFQNSAWSGPAHAFSRWQSIPVQRYSRSSVMQLAPTNGARVGMVEYSYVDNLGRLRYAQGDPDSTAFTAWSTLSPAADAYTGPPALTQQPDGRLQVAGHKTDGDVGTVTQQDPSIPSWAGWKDAGGWVTSDVTSGTLPDGRIVLFAVDGDGVLFANQQTAVNGGYGIWAAVGSLRVAGAPAVAPSQTGLQLFARDTSGMLRTAGYEVSGSLSDWLNLGASGSTGAPSVVVYPGYRLRLFVRAADGSIATMIQDNGGAWPASWQSTGAFTAAGAPVAILDPVLGRTAVVARGTDNEIYVLWETGQDTSEWGTWGRALNPSDPTFSDPAATDPTVAPVTNASGETWYIVFRNTNDTTRVYERKLSAPAAAAAGTAPSATSRTPFFNGRSMPKPPA
ncbi:hypothetical protein [Planosporangium mesophilum]|uniref:PLL-like beta propeller domain-containing protein n=1 Tax=Planosporangium mesophilum TaxID=689768 RepID=A0A8J3T7A2_9ACTN|nr:hypothetical protein [Planosporangium mesophilum]NJC81922.1 hypothetical protein [Planosporangium mesophilum]GII20416.1 hypothetical protein Pme01_00130 [Planosporangium mesophilum]